MPTQPVTTHQRFPVIMTDHVTHLLGVTSTSTLVSTAKNTVSNNLTVTKTNATGAHVAIVKTYSYSYDGVIHLDSYISDL